MVKINVLFCSPLLLSPAAERGNFLPATNREATTKSNFLREIFYHDESQTFVMTEGEMIKLKARRSEERRKKIVC
jgi:hypothetical protein